MSRVASDAQPLATFDNHRGIVPMLTVMAALSVAELLATHLFVAAKWPRVAWPLTIATALVVAWLVRWIASWRRRPHELHRDRLRLHVGSLRRIDVPLDSIVGVSGAISDLLLNRPQTHNLVPIAYPNRLLELNAPLPGRRRALHVALRVDYPLAFDAALEKVGVPVAT